MAKEPESAEGADTFELPGLSAEGHKTLEIVLGERRSVREFGEKELTVDQVSRLLWAAQGITGEEGERTAPSAGATYPLIVYLVAGRVRDLPAGVYRYHPHRHELAVVCGEDLREEIAAASLDQAWMAAAPACFLISANYDRTTNRYGERGVRYVRMEAGHAAQNLSLQAVALGLGSTVVGACDDRRIQDRIGMPDNEEPLCLIPVGYPR